jgi:hypothetical protein
VSAALGGFDEKARVFDAPLLCAGLLAPGEAVPALPPPEIVFRAAMLANGKIVPLASGAPFLSWRWTIGAGVWLPAWKGGRRKGGLLAG